MKPRLVMKSMIRKVIFTVAVLLLGGGVLLRPVAFGEQEGVPALPGISFTKVFPGSVPEYISIRVDAEGKGSYEGRALEEPSRPRSVRLSKPTVRRFFALAEQLGYFRDLEIPPNRRLAKMGEKTLVYEGPEGSHRVVFNYSKDPIIGELVELFESFSKSQRHLAQLEHEVKFDRLALAGHLRRIQADLNKNTLGEPKLLIPALRQIASSGRYLNMARTRARSILERLEQMESSE